jgi:phage shock protein PspC (stress-responsive transcriptional regulator)
MEKTLTINISGFVFHIDEDAYQILKDYLVKINMHFNQEEGGHEIISDIEARIAELFLEQTESKQGVINLNMVNQIIQIMGLPEDFAESTPEEDVESEQAPTPPYNRTWQNKKKLFRDPESRVLGGVCSGLSHYFNISKVLIRIILIILIIITSGTAFLPYLILWIAVPKARTTAQRLEMKGEPITVENIGRSVKEEFNEIKDGFQSSNAYQQNREHARNAGYAVQSTGQGIANVFSKLFGLLFIFIGFISTTVLIFTFFAATKLIGMIPGFHSGMFINHIFSGSMATTLTISLLIITVIPLLLLLYAGTKMVFNYAANSQSIVLSALGVWIIAIIVATSSGFGAIDIFSTDASVTSYETITNTSDTLYISLNKDQNKAYSGSKVEVNNLKIMIIDQEEHLVANPKFTIEPADEKGLKLKIKKESKGNNYRSAKKNANAITYSFSSQNKQLLLDPYFILEENGKWRNQEVKITLNLPLGKVVYLDDSLLPLIHDIENTSNTWDGDMTNTYWIMKPEGLTISN